MVAQIPSILEPVVLSRSDGNDLMVSQLQLGNQGVHSSGMSHVLTHLQPHMRYR